MTQEETKSMNGAQTLIRTLVDSGVNVCFGNPGTSEMHFVAALDSVPEMRSVLGLFEGVVTGAADGYARMARRPAATLLHLGPGTANGLANLHNAQKARTPIVNIIGDHATYHKKYDAPLESDIEGYAGVASHYLHTSQRAADVASDAAKAVAEACSPPGNVASLILPADVSWGTADGPAPPVERRPEAAVPRQRISEIAKVLQSGEPSALLLGGRALSVDNLKLAARSATACQAKFLCETFPARLTRGAGVPPIERLAYLSEMVVAQLQGVQHLIVIDTKSPVSFFAYPGKPGDLCPEGATVHTLVSGEDDIGAALAALAELVAQGVESPVADLARPDLPSGALDASTMAQAVGALLPENAVVSDESNTLGFLLPFHTAGAPAHDWLTLTGGAIGQGIPVATGAAVACPHRKVVSIEADGSAMYTLQGLWTQAREQLDVTTIILNNRAYGILNMELARVGATDTAEPGERAKEMLHLGSPNLDFVALSQGMGVPATRASTADEFVEQLREALTTPGPRLIEAVIQ